MKFIINTTEKDYILEIVQHLNSLPKGNYNVDIVQNKKRNSVQNNYYWRIIRILGNDLGYDEEDMHLIVKQHFKIISTKELSKYDFARFIEKLERWAISEFNVKL